MASANVIWIHREIHNAHGEGYVIDVYKVADSGDIRMYAYRGVASLIGMYGAAGTTVEDLQSQRKVEAIGLLLEEAKADIDADVGGQFGLRAYFESL